MLRKLRKVNIHMFIMQMVTMLIIFANSRLLDEIGADKIRFCRMGKMQYLSRVLVVCSMKIMI